MRTVLIHYLQPNLRSVLFALKGVSAVALALAVSMGLDLDKPFWAMVASMMLQARPETGLVIEKALCLILGSTLGAAVAIFILDNFMPYRGCTPESQKFPSAQLQSRHERIQVDELAVSLEGVMPVQQDVPPGRWRHLRDQRQRLGIASCLVLRQQQGQDRRVVEDDRVADQPGALVADLDFDVGAAGQFLLPTDLGDGRA
ncbi:hypothetical protein BZY59_30820 [Pseudomonas aeruginosa]|nr:hypothetical protein BZY59_30820 [Pseudomonas aeruginosa]